MDNEQFDDLRLKILVVPGQSTWPIGYVHWDRLHGCADLMRDAVGKAWREIDQVERDPDLSTEGQKRKAQKIALQAIADLEADKSLLTTRDACDQIMAKWRGMAGAVLKAPTNIHEATIHAQIRDRVAQMKTGRLGFIEKHGDDPVVASALLLAPSFLSNLSPTEVTAVRAKVETRVDPKIREAQEQVMRALREVEDSWPKVLKRIAERGGLTQDARTGAWTASQATA